MIKTAKEIIIATVVYLQQNFQLFEPSTVPPLVTATDICCSLKQLQ